MPTQLLKDIEDKYNKGTLNESDINEFNKSGSLRLSVSTPNNNYNLDKVNVTGQEFESNAFKSANANEQIVMERAKQAQDIEKQASAEKIARSDETRGELLETTGEFKDNSAQRREELSDITDHQKSYAATQANIAAAKSGRVGDQLDEGAKFNIQNDVINRYAQNIMTAEQYELKNNRSIDNDLLNVGLIELKDKNERDRFKDALLDKENAYMFDAIKKAEAGDVKAVRDVENFYQTIVKQKGSEEAQRGFQVERVQDFNTEFENADTTTKLALLRDMTRKEKGASYLDKEYEQLLKNYPNESLDGLISKIKKEGQYAFDQSMINSTVAQKDKRSRTNNEQDALDQAIDRGEQVRERSDKNTEDSRELNKDKIGDLENMQNKATITKDKANNILRQFEAKYKGLKDTNRNKYVDLFKKLKEALLDKYNYKI